MKKLIFILILFSQTVFGQVLWDCDSLYNDKTKESKKEFSSFLFNVNKKKEITNVLIKIKKNSFIYNIDLYKENDNGVSFMDKNKNYLSIDNIEEFIIYNEIAYYNCIVTTKE